MSQSVNQFTKLNSDLHPLNTKPDVMTDAVNATLTTRGENQLIVQNLKGNELVSSITSGFVPLAIEVYRGIAYIVSARYDINGVFQEGEIGTYPSPDWDNLLAQTEILPTFFLPLVNQYSPLRNFIAETDIPASFPVGTTLDSFLNNDVNYKFPFRTPKFEFRNDNLMEMELQPSYDGSVNILLTDDKNPIRLINSRFIVGEDGKSASIAQRRQNKDTNTYSDERFLATKIIKNPSKILDLRFNGVKNGGSLQGGGYKFYFKYIDSDGSLSDIIEESRLVAVGFDDHGANSTENTSKYIEFELFNLDYKFSGLKVYFSLGAGSGETTTIIKEIINPYDLPQDGSMILRIYGSELTQDISRDKLNLDFSSIDVVKSFTQKDDRLVLANITSVNDNLEKFRDLAQLFTITESEQDLKIKGAGEGYADPNNIYFNTGYWGYETYELAAVFILKDGRGNTPAFPLRGLDNFNGQQNYLFDPASSQATFDPIAESDGFITNKSENRLGVYRTNKNRTLLTGTDKDTTKIRYFKINIAAIFNPKLPVELKDLITDDIEGLFIVRRERKKDCVVQGYFTNTARVNINTTTKETTPFYWKSGVDNLIFINDENALTSIREPFGKKHADFNQIFKNTKIIPAPGRIAEFIAEDRCYNNSSPAFANPKSISIQGKVSPDPSIISFNGNDVEMNYAFYANDMLVNPAFFASLFNNSDKSIALSAINEPGVTMRQILHPNSNATIGNPGGNAYPVHYTGNGSTNLNAVPAYPAASNVFFDFITGNSAIDLYEASPLIGQTKGIITGTLNFRYYDTVLNPQWGDYIQVTTPQMWQPPIITNVLQPWNIQLNVTIDELGNLTATLPLTEKTTGTNIKRILTTTAPITGTWVNMSFGSILSASFSLNLPLSIQEYTFSAGAWVASGAPDTTVQVVTGNYGDAADLSFTLSNSSSSIIISGIDPNNTPIKILELDNFNFNPAKVLKCSTQYMSELLDAFTENNFSTISSRNHYLYTTRLTLPSPGNNVIENFGSSSLLSGNWRFLASDAMRFADYAGIRIEKVVDALNPLNPFTWIFNDATQVSNYKNFISNDVGMTGSDDGDWTFRLQHAGIRFAVLGNIYDSLDGALTTGNWKNKYINADFANGYSAVTKRINLKELQDVYAADNSKTFIDVFGGDCYINYTYKRAFYGTGVDGIPTASDPSLYREGEKSAGLYPKGFVFPLVMESNHNTSLRTFEFKDLIESGIYGKERTFYPVDNIDPLRASRQLESKGHNAGYELDYSDKQVVALNDRAPVLNISYDTRVLVSEPAVSGNFANGYNNFSGLNFRDYTKHLGTITRIIAHNNYLYCIQERGIGVVPMNQKTMISEQQGGVFLDNAQLLDPRLQVISTEYGSDQQFGIIKTDEHIYGCDLNKNKIWRIVTEGGNHRLELISDFAVQSILNRLKDKINSSGNKNFVKGNYDRNANNVIFTYYNVNNAEFVSDLFELVIPQNGQPSYVRKPAISGLYYNETLGNWVSRISWNPLFMFEIGNDIYSFSNKADGNIWKHYSDNVPYCNFYGDQHKFELEFILLDNASAQKVLDNLIIISNRSFPGRISYTIDKDVDYETFSIKDNSYIELMRQRHEDFNGINPTTRFINGKLYFFINVSIEELQRMQGGYFTFNNQTFILGQVYTDPNSNINYIEILDQNANIIQSNIALLFFNRLEFGIIKQNMEYIEDHLYVEVGKAQDSSLVRDKAIRIRLTYEGMNQTVIQSVISLFQYSFS